jgi:cell division GTPase FtsZ
LEAWQAMNDLTNSMPEIARGVPLIKVLGVGGGGSNAVSSIFIAAMSDADYP